MKKMKYMFTVMFMMFTVMIFCNTINVKAAEKVSVNKEFKVSIAKDGAEKVFTVTPQGKAYYRLVLVNSNVDRCFAEWNYVRNEDKWYDEFEEYGHNDVIYALGDGKSYEFHVYNYSDKAATATFKVVKLSVEDVATLTVGKASAPVTVKANSTKIRRFTFTPQTTGAYIFRPVFKDDLGRSYLCSFQLRDENMNLIELTYVPGIDCEEEDPDAYYYRLIQGKKYYAYMYYGAADTYSMKVDFTYYALVKDPVILSNGIKLNWVKADGATGYYIYRNYGSKPIATIKNGSTTSYLDKKVKNATNYYYEIIPFNGSKKGYTTHTENYIRFLSRPSIKASNVKGKKIKVSWKKNKKAKGYVVRYTLGSTTYTKTIANRNTTSIVLKGLKKGKTYKIQVRAYAWPDYPVHYPCNSAWSTTKKVKVKK